MAHGYFNESSAGNELHHRSLRGGAISLVAQGGGVVLQVVSTIVLGRILLPEDFGLVAMVSAVTGFASIFVDLGTRDAVAQRGSIREGEVSALFWITFAIGLALTTVTLVISPFIAAFYGDPRLEYIAMAMSTTFVLPALYFQQYALMRRALMFKTLAMIDIGANLAATVISIGLAFWGRDYWALVWKQVLTAAFTAAGVWATCGWWPKRPTFTPTVKELLGFGLNVTGFTISDYIARSVDRIALGYKTGPRELGYYQNAYTVYDNGINVCSPLHNVATAALSKLRDDIGGLRRAWENALSTLTYFLAPAFALVAVVGQDLVVLLLGDKWKGAGVILSVLALRGPAHVVERTLGWLHVTAGRPERWRRWGLLNCALTIVALLCGLPYGAIGVATAYVVYTWLTFVPAIAYAGHPLGISARDVVRVVGPQVGTALLIAGLGFALGHTLLQDLHHLTRLVLLGVVCGVVYIGVMTLVFRKTKPLTVALSLVRARRSVVA